MKWKRIGSSALALVLVCCLIFNMMTVPAKATGFEILIPVGVSTVAVPVAPVAIACLVLLGLYAGAESGAFADVAQRLEIWLYNSRWTHDDRIELYRTTLASGEHNFYVNGEVLEAVRSWALSESVAEVGPVAKPATATGSFGTAYDTAALYPYALWCDSGSKKSILYSDAPFVLSSDPFSNQPVTGTGSTYVRRSDGGKFKYWNSYNGSVSNVTNFAVNDMVVNWFGTEYTVVSSPYDLTIGTFPTSYIDGTSALEWAPEYANRQLRVINTGGGSSPDGDGEGDPKWKWYAPIVLGTVAGLLTQVQSDQWQGNQLDDVPEYDVIQDYDIVDNPDIDGLPGIEIKPVTVPEVDPDPDPGTDPDPGPGTDGEVITGTFADTAVGSFINALINALWTPIRWLGEPAYRLGEYVGKIVRGEISIPEAWQQLLSSVVSNPIVSAIQKIISGEITLPQALSLGLSEIVSLITTIAGPVVGAIPQTLAEIASWCVNLPSALADLFTSVIVEPLLAGLSYMFVPSADYLSAKVDAIRAEFGFADGIIAGAEMIRDMFSGLDPEPPVIWIDLTATRGSYYIGEKVKFLDMTWYAEYKPTVDKLLSALIWIVFIWQTFKRLPGIISGVPGDFVMDGIHVLGLEDRLPSRNAAYEIQRRDLRDQIRRSK